MNHEVIAYQAALDYLYQFVDSNKPAPTPQTAALKLERMRALLAMLGHPQESLSCVVVAGTKGKGSTCAMLESMVRAAGYRTGLWTSPHLHSYRERIQINRQRINQAALVAGVEHLQPLVARFDQGHYGPPTTFELGLALALRFFVEQGVELAVIEVGVGGRYDAANVITPLVSVISSLSYDHMHILGSTLAEIAYDKAGILKPGVPAVTVPQLPAAEATLIKVAQTVDVPLWVAGGRGLRGVIFSPLIDTVSAEWLAYPVEPVPALRGAFQQENARLALGAALLLREQGLVLPDAALAQGLAGVQWPGRLELAATSPLLVLDGAHNDYSAQRLLEALRQEFQFARLVLVLGISQHKDIGTLVAALVPQASALVLTHSHHPRAYVNLEQLATEVCPYLQGALVLAPDVAGALEQARTLAAPDDLICVTGSLFVVAAARAALGLAEVVE